MSFPERLSCGSAEQIPPRPVVVSVAQRTVSVVALTALTALVTFALLPWEIALGASLGVAVLFSSCCCLPRSRHVELLNVPEDSGVTFYRPTFWQRFSTRVPFARPTHFAPQHPRRSLTVPMTATVVPPSSANHEPVGRSDDNRRSNYQPARSIVQPSAPPPRLGMVTPPQHFAAPTTSSQASSHQPIGRSGGGRHKFKT
jgi:hypothetical protein